MITLIYRYSNANKRLQCPCTGSPRSHRASPHLKAAVTREKTGHLWAASAPKSRNETQLTYCHYSRGIYKTLQKKLKGVASKKTAETRTQKKKTNRFVTASLKKRITIISKNKQQPDTNYLHTLTVNTMSLVPHPRAVGFPNNTEAWILAKRS